MVADNGFSVWFVGNAARLAGSHPCSEPFRQAIRRRDAPDFRHDHGARLAVFDYFVTSGDTTDLAWMEQMAMTRDKTRRPSAACAFSAWLSPRPALPPSLECGPEFRIRFILPRP
jgi:hypothetical protein